MNANIGRGPARPGALGAGRARAIALACRAFATPAGPAGETVIVPPDSNSRITVENAVTSNGETTVFFVSWPYLGDPQSGKPCPLNYYAATVRPGLATPRLVAVARGGCGGLIQNGALQANGDATVLNGGRWDRWRDGERLDSKSLGSLDALSSLGFDDDASLPQFFDPAPNGDLVIAVLRATAGAGGAQGGELNVTRLTADGKVRWTSRPEDSLAGVMEARTWAGPDGGALVHSVSPAQGDAVSVYDVQGHVSRFSLSAGDPMMALERLGEMDPQQAQAFFMEMADSKPESIKQVAAKPAPGGGWDVMFERRGPENRQGHFLLRIGADGAGQPERNLGEAIGRFGLEHWYDFYVTDNALVLLSRALATQKIIDGRPRGRAQNIVSWIDLDTGSVSPHLLPLDGRYLDAALVAGDAEIQYLDGLPDSEPALLSRLGDRPLVASIGWVERRQVLRLQEASRDLDVFTEVVEKRQAEQAEAAARQRRKADREATGAELQASAAAAAGMSLEDFQALSEDDQMEAIIRNGGTGQLIQSMMRKSDQLMARQQAEGTGGETATMPGEFSAQLESAMTQARQELASMPGMTPEMAAQMQAAMGQLSQGMGGAAAGVAQTRSGTAAGSGHGSAVDDNGTLALDPAGRAFVEFESDGGQALRLRIYDRRSGRDLFSKDYPDGVIYEYIDFNRFGVPLDQVVVSYLGANGSVLRQLSPVLPQ